MRWTDLLLVVVVVVGIVGLEKLEYFFGVLLKWKEKGES